LFAFQLVFSNFWITLHLGTGKLDKSIAIMFKGILVGEIADLELGVWAGEV
jgi:hypothetical protein